MYLFIFIHLIIIAIMFAFITEHEQDHEETDMIFAFKKLLQKKGDHKIFNKIFGTSRKSFVECNAIAEICMYIFCGKKNFEIYAKNEYCTYESYYKIYDGLTVFFIYPPLHYFCIFKNEKEHYLIQSYRDAYFNYSVKIEKIIDIKKFTTDMKNSYINNTFYNSTIKIKPKCEYIYYPFDKKYFQSRIKKLQK